MVLKNVIFLFVFMLSIACSVQHEKEFTPIPHSYFNAIKKINQVAGQDIKAKFCDVLFDMIKPTHVVLRGIHHHSVVPIKLRENCIFIKIQKQLIRDAGSYSLDLIASTQILTIAHIEITADQTHGKINSYAGPKSLLYNDKEGSMITMTPVDQFYNPTGHQTAIKYTISKDNKTQNKTSRQDGNFSSIIVHEGQRENIYVSGKTEHGSTIDHHIRSLSGCPKHINIETQQVNGFADGRKFFKASTKKLIDPKGNIIENGTIILFSIYDDKQVEVAQYVAHAINGIATCWIKNPIYDGEYTLAAYACNKKSDLIFLTFKPVIKTIQYAWKPNHDKILIGPLITTEGNLIANGTPITVSFEKSETEQKLKMSTVDGFAKIDLEKLWLSRIPENASVEVFGKKFSINQVKI